MVYFLGCLLQLIIRHMSALFTDVHDSGGFPLSVEKCSNEQLIAALLMFTEEFNHGSYPLCFINRYIRGQGKLPLRTADKFHTRVISRVL